MPVYVHAEACPEFADAVRLGADAVMHGLMDRPFDDSDAALIESIKEQDVYYVPTLFGSAERRNSAA